MLLFSVLSVLLIQFIVQSTALDAGNYWITNRATGRPLDNDGSNVYTYDYSNCGNYQLWTLTKTGDYWFIKNVQTQKYLDSSSTIYMNSYNGGNYQQWSLVSTSSYYSLKNRQTGYYVEWSGGTSKVVMSTTQNSNKEQNWVLTLAESSLEYVLANSVGPYAIVNKGTGMYLDSNNKDNAPYGGTSNGLNYQRWQIWNKSAYFTIRSRQLSSMLDSTDAGSVYVLDNNDGDYQKWWFFRSDDGYFWIKNAKTGRALQCSSTGALSTQSQGYDDSQKWSIVPQYTIKINILSSVADMATVDQLKALAQQEFVETTYLNNNSTATVTRTRTYSKTFDNSITVGYSTNIKVGAKVSVEGKIPLGAEIGVEVSVETEFGSSQSTTYTTSNTMAETAQFSIPSYSYLKTIGFISMVRDYSLPFVATAEMTISGNSAAGMSDTEVTLTDDAASKYLKLKGFDGTILSSSNGKVKVQISGTAKGSFGVISQIYAQNN